VPRIGGWDEKLMCVGREPAPDVGGGVFGKEEIGRTLVVSVWVLVCMSGCCVDFKFGSRKDTMAPIICENMEGKWKTEKAYFESVFALTFGIW
jgi:hypothetical protein